MKKEKYVPMTEADWKKKYPGQISAERKKQLDELRYEAKDLTADDIVYTLTNAYKGLFHTMVKAMKDIVGEDKTKEIILHYGKQRGAKNILRFINVAGSDPKPDQWAQFQDCVHYAGGLDHSRAIVKYDDDKCVVVRRSCGMFSNDPETREYCKYFHIGAISSYNEKVPTVESTLGKCMATGDDCCEDFFIRRKKK